jgi:hypothetical protein
VHARECKTAALLLSRAAAGIAGIACLTADRIPAAVLGRRRGAALDARVGSADDMIQVKGCGSIGVA